MIDPYFIQSDRPDTAVLRYRPTASHAYSDGKSSLTTMLGPLRRVGVV